MTLPGDGRWLRRLRRPGEVRHRLFPSREVDARNFSNFSLIISNFNFTAAVATQQPTAHATVTTTTMAPHNTKCACSNFMLEFDALGVDSVCGNNVLYKGMFKKRCLYRRATGKEVDPFGKTKDRYANKKAVNEDIAVKALATADTVREDTTSVMVANAIVIVTDLVKTIRSEVKDETLCTHHIFRTAVGSTKYVGKDAVQTELELSSLYTVPISDRRKNGRKGSIVMTDYNEHGVNYTSVTPTDARAMYIANKDSVMLQRFKKPIVLCSTMDANKAAAVECAAQKYIKREIVKSGGGQFSVNNRALWKIDGQGGAGNGTGMGPYEIAYACIVHNPTADADDRYPDASLWSRTLPVDGLIFENDVKKNGLHYKDAEPVELLDSDDENEHIIKKQRTMASEDSKPAAKPSVEKPAAKSTKAKKVTTILTYFDKR
jgi:hypothetical protein